MACLVIFLLDSTTLDNYQETCFHPSTYSPSKNTALSSCVTEQADHAPTCEVGDAKLHGLCLPLQLPLGTPFSHAAIVSTLSRLAPAQGFTGCSLSEILSVICFLVGLISLCHLLPERPSLPVVGRIMAPQRGPCPCWNLLLCYLTRQKNFQIQLS